MTRFEFFVILILAVIDAQRQASHQAPHAQPQAQEPQHQAQQQEGIPSFMDGATPAILRKFVTFLDTLGSKNESTAERAVRDWVTKAGFGAAYKKFQSEFEVAMPAAEVRHLAAIKNFSPAAKALDAKLALIDANLSLSVKEKARLSQEAIYAAPPEARKAVAAAISQEAVDAADVAKVDLASAKGEAKVDRANAKVDAAKVNLASAKADAKVDLASAKGEAKVDRASAKVDLAKMNLASVKAEAKVDLASAKAEVAKKQG